MDIRVKDKIYSINSLYRPLNEDQESDTLFLQEMEKILLSMSQHKSDNFVLASDLNFGNVYCKFPILDPKPLDNTAPELFKSFGLNQMIDIPTRISGNCTSLIDLIFCRIIDNIQAHGTLPPLADHEGTFIAFHCIIEKSKPVTKTIFDYKSIDEGALIQYIKNINFDLQVFSRPATEQAEAITEVLTEAFNKFIPRKTVTVRPSDQPWVNSYTRLLLRKKNRNYQFYKKVNSHYLNSISGNDFSAKIVTRLGSKRSKAENAYKLSNFESNNANRRAKQTFFNTITATMHNHNISSKKKFCILSKLMKNNKISHIPPIIEDEKIVTDPKQKANIFNNFFASKSSVQGADDPTPVLPQKDDIFEKLSAKNTSPIEIAKLCRDIKNLIHHIVVFPESFLP